MANLYVDEDLGNFVSPLREAGHTVQFAGDTGPGRTDAWHLAMASKQQRILVTFNEQDYRYLHRLWTSLRIFGLFSRRHAGILSATAQLESTIWIPELNRLLQDQPMAERMWVWHQAKGEWREDKWRPEAR
jgi:hypothetical protein